MPTIPPLEDLLKAGVHFGHATSKWHPKMTPFIFTQRNGVHILNLEKTRDSLARALDFVRDTVAAGKVILFVGTKKQAKEIVARHAKTCGQPYMTERWLGGLLTNWNAVQNLVRRYRDTKKMFETGEIQKYTKAEQVHFAKDMEKIEKEVIGIAHLDRVPDVLFVQDIRNEKTAVREAARMKIPTVAVCDSNVNPEQITYPIPANDDGIKAIEFIVSLVADAVREGKAIAEANKPKEVEKGPKVFEAPAPPRVKEENPA